MSQGTPKFSPYIGVTGFMTQSEVASGIEASERFSPWARHQLMIGVMVSARTLAGESHSSRPNQFPDVNDVASLFSLHRRVVNLIHFNSKDKAPAIWVNDFLRLKTIGGRNCDGVQINIPWPAPSALQCLKGKRVVLSIGHEAQRIAQHDSNRVVSLLEEYVEMDVITDILIDMSEGKGTTLNPTAVEPYLHAIRAAYPALGIGTAGGLCADVMGKMKTLIATFPNLSLDATTRLRTSDDHLSVDAMMKYLRTASGMLT